jgi:hypothetical protein
MHVDIAGRTGWRGDGQGSGLLVVNRPVTIDCEHTDNASIHLRLTHLKVLILVDDSGPVGDGREDGRK